MDKTINLRELVKTKHFDYFITLDKTKDNFFLVSHRNKNDLFITAKFNNLENAKSYFKNVIKQAKKRYKKGVLNESSF